MIDISVTDLVKSFDLEKKILDGVSFQIDTGERVGLLGKNGAGKSTLFNILTGELDYDSGQVLIAPGRRVGLISQIPVYPAGYTVEDVLRSAFQRTTALKEEMDRLTRQMEQGDSDPQTLRRYGELTARFEGLGGYDTDTAVNKVSNGLSIDGDMRQRLFDQLSGGEKTRVNLGRLILEDTDILLLDEPTNHLDMDSREVLEDALQDFPGTILAISHDRYFINRFADRVMVMNSDGVTEYLGNFDDYVEKRDRPQPPAPVAEGEVTRTAATRERKRDRQQAARARELQAQVKRAEEAIEENERLLRELEAKLADPATYADAEAARELGERYRAEQARSEALYEALEAAEAEAEAAE